MNKNKIIITCKKKEFILVSSYSKEETSKFIEYIKNIINNIEKEFPTFTREEILFEIIFKTYNHSLNEVNRNSSKETKEENKIGINTIAIQDELSIINTYLKEIICMIN